MLITLEPTFVLQLQPYIVIEDTCRIILVPNTMLLAILRFNYNVNYVKRKKHNQYWEVKLMCDSHYYVLRKEGRCLRTEGSFLNVLMA